MGFFLSVVATGQEDEHDSDGKGYIQLVLAGVPALKKPQNNKHLNMLLLMLNRHNKAAISLLVGSPFRG